MKLRDIFTVMDGVTCLHISTEHDTVFYGRRINFDGKMNDEVERCAEPYMNCKVTKINVIHDYLIIGLKI